ncbi:Rieske (2Fe-2S) protein [bacterium]|nr:Rieske (2Fe-2S) protein [bacterium]
MNNFSKIGHKSDFHEAKPKKFRINDKNILVCLYETKFYALENDCPHQGEPLDKGVIKDYCVSCPAHNWSFDLRTGDSPVIPDAFIYTFDVNVDDEGFVWVSHKKNL